MPSARPDDRAATGPLADSRTAIERFAQALWIEDGLAPLTLAA
ncbi:MAG: site-specific tyrosine recombinase XerD, partial [Rubrivivax sp.]|nr:site-specific tyrosine recombinase XerD [Rubrivivax sp.]